MNEHTHKVYTGRGETKGPGPGPDVDTVSHAGALCLLIVTCVSIPSSCSVIPPYTSHPSSTLCSKHTPVTVPAGHLPHAALPLDSCSFSLEHAASSFFIPYLPQQLPLPSRVTSRTAQFVKAFLIIPTAFLLHWLSSALFSLYRCPIL